MEWQLIVTFGVIALAGAFFAWRIRRAWRSMRGGSCSGGCGCAKTTESPKNEPALIAPEELVLRARVAK